jgi:hypothetical protein
MHWTVTDLTPPWQPAADTIVFTHGVGPTSEVWSAWLPGVNTRPGPVV